MNAKLIQHLEVLIDFANKHFTEDSEVDIAADKVKQYLQDYKLDNQNYGDDQ